MSNETGTGSMVQEFVHDVAGAAVATLKEKYRERGAAWCAAYDEFLEHGLSAGKGTDGTHGGVAELVGFTVWSPEGQTGEKTIGDRINDFFESYSGNEIDALKTAWAGGLMKADSAPDDLEKLAMAYADFVAGGCVVVDAPYDVHGKPIDIPGEHPGLPRAA